MNVRLKYARGVIPGVIFRIYFDTRFNNLLMTQEVETDIFVISQFVCKL